MKVISRLFILIVVLAAGFVRAMDEQQLGDGQQPAPIVAAPQQVDDNPDAAPLNAVQPAQQQDEAAAPCSICFEDTAGRGEPAITQLHCNHIFCTDCIANLYPARHSVMGPVFRCPNCRGDLTGDDVAKVRRNYTSLHPERRAQINKYEATKALITVISSGLILYGAYHLWNEEIPANVNQIQTPAQKVRGSLWNAYKTVASIYDCWYYPTTDWIAGIINTVHDGYNEHHNIQFGEPQNYRQLYAERAVNLYNRVRFWMAFWGHIRLGIGAMNRMYGYVDRLQQQHAEQQHVQPVPPMLR